MEDSSLEGLMADAGWVRALARELVGPGHADDLVQDAWLVVLRRSGKERNLAAWLGGVVRRLAGRARRGERNRARREGLRASADTAPPAEELAAQAEIQARVIAAVLALEEPYRSTVLLRYFRGLSLAETATTLGVPRATARTRLQRALARLRETLERKSGREVWKHVALQLHGEPEGGLAPLARAARALPAKLGLLAAVSGAVTILVVQDGRTGVEEASQAAGREEPVRERSIQAEPVELAAVSAHAVPLPRASVPGEARATSEGTLAYGDLTDENGAFVEGAWVTLDDEQGLRLGGPTSERWSWTIDGLHPGRWTLRAGGRDVTPIERDFVVPPGELVVKRDIVLESGIAIPVRILDGSAESLSPAQLGVRLVASLEPLPEDFEGVSSAPGSFGVGEFLFPGASTPGRVPDGCCALFRCSVPLPVVVSAVVGDAVLDTKTVTSPSGEIVFRIRREDVEQSLGGLRVRLVDAYSRQPVTRGSGQLLPGQSPAIAGLLAATMMRVSSAIPVDELGELVFERQPPGPSWLSFRAADHVRPPLGVRVPRGRIVDLGEAPVWPKVRLRGEVLDEQEDHAGVLCAWTVLSEMSGPLDLERETWHQIGGRFELDVARAPLWFLLRANDGTLSGQRIDASNAEVESVVIRLRAGTTVTFRHGQESSGELLAITDEGGLPIAAADLEGGELELRLAPGRYQLWSGTGERMARRTGFEVGTDPIEIVVPPPVDR